MYPSALLKSTDNDLCVTVLSTCFCTCAIILYLCYHFVLVLSFCTCAIILYLCYHFVLVLSFCTCAIILYLCYHFVLVLSFCTCAIILYLCSVFLLVLRFFHLCGKSCVCIAKANYCIWKINSLKKISKF